VRRLADEWAAGVDRFDPAGEALRTADPVRALPPWARPLTAAARGPGGRHRAM